MRKQILIALLLGFVVFLVIAFVFAILHLRPLVGPQKKECANNTIVNRPEYVFKNIELFEKLGLANNRSDAKYSAHILYDLGVQGIIDISFEKVEIRAGAYEYRVHIIDSENKEYFFVLNDAGRLWTAREGDENGEVLWQWSE